MANYMYDVLKSNWTLIYPDATMASGTTFNGKTLADISPKLHTMLKQDQSNSERKWLPLIFPNGTYMRATPSTTATTSTSLRGTPNAYTDWWTAEGSTVMAAW